MLMNDAQYARWLEIVAIANDMPTVIVHRMRCVFDWATAVFELLSLNGEEIASAAASHFEKRCNFD